MVAEVRIYVEGGGQQRRGKAAVQEGLNRFLRSLRDLARRRFIRWRVIACGSRDAAFRAFVVALGQNPDAFNILLVDAEAPVRQTPWTHLRERDAWQRPPAARDDHCHLMVQVMESWLIADVDTLRAFYGQGFNANPFPGGNDVETVDKARVEAALADATRRTQKGGYHKILHGPKLLGQVSVALVRQKAPHCERLFRVLTGIIEGAS